MFVYFLYVADTIEAEEFSSLIILFAIAKVGDIITPSIPSYLPMVLRNINSARAPCCAYLFAHDAVGV